MLCSKYKIISAFIRNLFLYATLLPALFIQQVQAAVDNHSAGGIADDMMEPLGLFGSFVNAGCLILGISFIFASLIKYIEHRRSPLMVPISTVVFLVIGGLALLLIPFFSYYYNQKLHLGL